MPITEKQLRELISEKPEAERISTISSDGKNLLTRIPKEIREILNLKKGSKIIWKLKKGEILLEFKDAEKKNILP